MTKTAAFLFATSLLFTVACDSGEDPVTERSADVEADRAPDAAPGERGHHGKRGDRAKFAAEKLCEDLDCTEAQAEQVTQLLASHHEGRDPAQREARRAARASANELIADAFRADSFDPAVLERARPDRDGERAEEMIAMASELHAILTPVQRAKLADRIAEGGPMFFGPPRGPHGEGPHGRHEGPHDKHEGKGSERLAAHVDALCQHVGCTDDQRAALTQTLEDAREAHHESRERAPEPNFSAIAELMRADTLDTAKLRETLDAGRAEHEARKAEMAKQIGAVVVEVHGILTPEQRSIVADLIEAEGFDVLLRGKHGERHGKRGKHGKRDKQDNVG